MIVGKSEVKNGEQISTPKPTSGVVLRLFTIREELISTNLGASMNTTGTFWRKYRDRWSNGDFKNMKILISKYPKDRG